MIPYEKKITKYSNLAENDSLSVYDNEWAAQQNHNAFEAFYYFLDEIKPKRILEIGTALGGFTSFLNYACKKLEIDCKILSYDINDRGESYNVIRQQGIDVRIEDIFLNNYSEIKEEIQNFIILALLSGVLIPPRRSKDYCDFKIKNITETKDNFLKKGKMVFNSYKTAKTYGTQEVPIETPLTTILNSWIKINPTDWLLFDSNMNKLTPVKLNQRLNKIFGDRKISVNQMRHTYLTEKFGEHSKKDKELANVVEEMGTSKNMLTTYVKE